LCAFCRHKLPKILTVICFSFAICIFYRLTKSHMEDAVGLVDEFKFEDNETGHNDNRLCEPRLKHSKFNVFEKDQNQSAIEKSLEEYSHKFYETDNTLIKFGGFYEPINCTSPSNLGNGTFNKGILMNSAFKWVQQNFDGRFDCFVFHDVDLISEMINNLYKCGDQPIHLSPAVSKLDYMLPYKELIGGVLAFRPNQFIKINGYSNVYWGWGGEDDDMYKRLKISGMIVQRPPLEVGRYFMLSHEKRTWISHANTYKLLGKSYSRMKSDGLNNDCQKSTNS
uniref:Uncharacterized protein n=1 Tax=Romanomermis culicivorax TaxID=13658 RepID=A0A915IZV0_ROMCU